jgi:hypothetical protein
MPLTNFPGGVGSYGIPVLGSGTLYDMPSAEVLFVCNRAGVTAGDGSSRDKPLPSIADAIVKINTTSGLTSGAAFIVVLSGHAENVTGSNIFSGSSVNTTSVTIPAGTRIIGEGSFNSRPTLTFTAAGSTLALAAANITIENMVLQCATTCSTATTAGVTVTAPGCMLRNNLILTNNGTASVFTSVVTLSSAVTQFWFLDNVAYGVAGSGTPTNIVATTGTTGAQNVIIQRNTMAVTLSATGGGLIDVSSASGTAPVNWIITDNTLVNLVASSTVVIKGVASWTGIVAYNNFGIGVTTNGTTTSINTPASVMSFQNFVTSGGKWAIVGGGTGAQTS